MKLLFLLSSLFLVTCSQSVKEPEQLSSNQLWKVLFKVKVEEKFNGTNSSKNGTRSTPVTIVHFNKKQKELAGQTITIEGYLNNNDQLNSILSQKKLPDLTTDFPINSIDYRIIKLNTVLAQELSNKAVKITGKLELNEKDPINNLYYINDVILELK